VVEPPNSHSFFGTLRTPVLSHIPPETTLAVQKHAQQHHHHHHGTTTTPTLYSGQSVASLPVLTAVAPNSPAERAGLTVGDRLVAVQKDSFLGLTGDASQTKLQQRYQGADNYAGTVDLTIAKPVYASATAVEGRNVIVAYRPQHIRLSTTTPSWSSPLLETNRNSPAQQQEQQQEETKVVAGGNAILQYRLLTGAPSSSSSSSLLSSNLDQSVGYIRLTRFSKASTAAFVQAVETLEAAHADSYILDLRNNYGGVIQEAMLTASCLLRDPHAVLCYTLNSRGGFTPHDVEEYVVDPRYPGYLLSREAKSVTLAQVKKESPEFFSGTGGWTPPSSYASLHEQHVKRRLQTSIAASTLSSQSSLLSYASTAEATEGPTPLSPDLSKQYQQLLAQKPIVLLVNEGTASSAEVFASSLHDNGRTVAIVGTRTYGKG